MSRGVWGHADRLISPSAALAQALAHAGVVEQQRIQVISNGIDLSSFRQLTHVPSAVVRFLCVAYLGEHKGILDLIDAAGLLAQDRRLQGRWTLTIAGDGHLREVVERRIATLGLRETVNCVGRVPRTRIIEMLAHTDVAVLPSRWPENEPVSLLEAMAAGVAQLATDVGGIKTLVEHGETGTLVPPSSPGLLAQAMKAYVDAPERARVEGANNLARREAFAQEACTRAVLSVYADVLDGEVPSKPSDPVVICAGPPPSPEDIEACNRLHESEAALAGGRQLRLLWHEWVPSEVWGEAAAFWHWGNEPLDYRAAHEALNWGLSVIASPGCKALASIGNTYGGVVTMDTDRRVRDVLVRVATETPQRQRSRDIRNRAEMLTEMAPQESFHLACPDNWP